MIEYQVSDIVKRQYKRKYLFYFIKELLSQKILRDRLRIGGNKELLFAGKVLPDNDETNNIIYEAIKSGESFALVRPGNGEVDFALEWEEEKLYGRHLYKRKGNNYSLFMKMFSDRADEYNYLFRRDISDADILSVFPNSVQAQYLVDRYCKTEKIVSLREIAPYYARRPWTDALKGKKVVVVSQFADFLKQQYEKKSMFFNGQWQFPEFELIPVKSVWYFGPNESFQSWFEALDYLYNEIMKHDFDIALLSCGPFAINLAPMIKRAGKQAIQYGGELQMMFGIRGARWDENPLFKKHYNDAWIRISKDQSGISEEDARNLDNGVCYW